MFSYDHVYLNNRVLFAIVKRNTKMMPGNCLLQCVRTTWWTCFL